MLSRFVTTTPKWGYDHIFAPFSAFSHQPSVSSWKPIRLQSPSVPLYWTNRPIHADSGSGSGLGYINRTTLNISNWLIDWRIEGSSAAVDLTCGRWSPLDSVAVLRWGHGHRPPKSCPVPPKFFQGNLGLTFPHVWCNWFYSNFA